MKACILLLGFTLFCAIPAQARVEAQKFATPQEEARYKQLIYELRCLVCQNQNLADSNAELAKQLREITYEMIRAGNTDQQIIDFMVQRYGDFVLYRPPVNEKTFLLWAGPFLLLLIAGITLVVLIRRNRTKTPEVSIRDFSDTRNLLEGDDGEKL